MGAGGGGQVGTLFFAYAQLGLHNWLDMRQALLTLEGMRQGVRDSDVFLLVLTENVLNRWYCQQARRPPSPAPLRPLARTGGRPPVPRNPCRPYSGAGG